MLSKDLVAASSMSFFNILLTSFTLLLVSVGYVSIIFSKENTILKTTKKIILVELY